MSIDGLIWFILGVLAGGFGVILILAAFKAGMDSMDKIDR